MARIRAFEQIDATSKVHPTEVECGYQAIHTTHGTLLQLSTYGSDLRQSDKKVSQTIQLDRDAASQLIAIIRRTFPGL